MVYRRWIAATWSVAAALVAGFVCLYAFVLFGADAGVLTAGGPGTSDEWIDRFHVALRICVPAAMVLGAYAAFRVYRSLATPTI